MKKKIVADLTSLAHKVLQLKNHDTTALKHTAQQLYDTLCVLEFVENHYDNLGPTIGKAKVLEILEQIAPDVQPETPAVETQIESVEVVVEDDDITFTSNDLSDLFIPIDDDTREVMELPGIATISKMVEEMGDDEDHAFPELAFPELVTPPPVPVVPPAIPQVAGNEVHEPEITKRREDLEDIIAAFQTMPEFERKVVNDATKPVSLNDRLKKGFVIGMNDRLGFVKHLFGGNDQDLNRVLSQLNTMESFKAARDFVESMVKPDYNNWSGKEQYEVRFMDLLESKFEN
jgi:Asp-tRNA(Asn)/Glu-tRNA(Gln) amidotransferase C subunit